MMISTWFFLALIVVLVVVALTVGGVALILALATRSRPRPARQSGGRSKLVPVVLGTLALLAVFFVLTVAAVLVLGWTANASLDIAYAAVLGVAVLAVLSLPTAGLVFWLMSGGRKDAPAPRREPAGPGFRLVVAAWVIGVVIITVIGLGYESSRLGFRWLGVERYEWAAHFKITAPVIAGALIFWTVLRYAWVNRRRLAASVRFAYDTPARPAAVIPAAPTPAPAAAPPARPASPPSPPAFKWPDDEQSLLRQRLLAVLLSLLIVGGLLVMFVEVVPRAGFGVSAVMLYVIAFVTVLSAIAGLLRWGFRRPAKLAGAPVVLSPAVAAADGGGEPRRSPESSRACPRCGAAIAAGAPEGLCPRCLLGDLLPEDPKHSPTTAYGPFVPPEVEEVAAFFPQLEVIRLIGQGGMGAVYLARQKALDRLVALKLINAREDDPTFAERFAREAKAMARLSHPNVVTVYESGVADSLPYLVMEYVDGVTLRDAMRTKKLTPAEALKVIPQVCDALEYAHSQGVVHRDVKPENILLDRSGKVKIADFGLAKLADPDGVSLTRTHQAMGTPHYMAPEQWERPGEVDHRADIYALGVLLYELLTGELPLGRFDPPSVKARVDARIDELVLRALAKEPDRRFQHASDVKLALARLAEVGGWVRSPTFREYKSKATFLGWPLVHVVGGRNPRTGRPKVAKGWIAIGDGAAVGGIAVAGGQAVGGVAVSGGMSFGVVALSGGIAGGVFALAGGIALALAAAAAGGMAIAGGLAVAGGFAVGTFALGGAAKGFHVLSGERQDPDFGQRLGEWVQTIWTDYLWPF
jgi:predicted Ser/Thr protein kinase